MYCCRIRSTLDYWYHVSVRSVLDHKLSAILTSCIDGFCPRILTCVFPLRSPLPMASKKGKGKAKVWLLCLSIVSLTNQTEGVSVT